MRRSVLIGAVICVALGVSARLASAQELPAFDRALVDYFLKLDGVPGESQDRIHKGEMEVVSFSQETRQAATTMAGAGPGHSAQRANIGNLVVTRRLDIASPKLFVACCAGTHFRQAVLSGRRAGKDPGKGPRDFLTITLSDVTVSSYRIASGGDVPTEEISLSFGRIDYEYRAQNPDGTPGAVAKGGWDLVSNRPRAVDGNTPVNDAAPVITPK